MFYNKYFSYVWEGSAKIFGLLSTFIIIFILNKEQLGDYSFIRSYILILGALSLLGLQAASYKFLLVDEGRGEGSKSSYVWFVVLFSMAINLLLLVFLFVFSFFIINSFPVDVELVYLMQGVVAIYTVTTFYSVVCKVIGDPSKGFFISMLIPMLFVIALMMLYYFGYNDLYAIILLYGCSVIAVFFVCLYFINKEYSFFHALININIEKIKGWFSVSISMWLSGFLPAFLTQGVVVFSGFYFSEAALGDVGLAVLIVANLAMFKEIGIALFLPNVIREYSKSKFLDMVSLVKCFLFSIVPILIFIAILLLLSDEIIFFSGGKVSSESIELMVLLSFSQVFMGIYQPVFRIYSVVYSHMVVLLSSVFLFIFLIVMYGVSANYYDVYHVVYSTVSVSFVAVLISIFYLKGLINE